jgi:DNA polymerase-3 subunit epsilon
LIHPDAKLLAVRRVGWRRDPAQLHLFDPSSEGSGRPPLWHWSWVDGELLCFDLETTGVDRFADVPVSFALVGLRAGTVCERRVAIVNPGRPIPLEAARVHGITDALARREGIPLDVAIEQVAGRLVEASERGVPTVGCKLDFDLTMLDVLCRAIDGRGLHQRGWRGPVLDVLVLDRYVDRYREGHRTLVDLCALYGVAIDRAHAAEFDAEAAGRVVLSMAGRYEGLGAASLNQLHTSQVGWHREWVASFNSWREGRGLAPLEPHEEEWPVASVPCGEIGAA